MIVPRSAIATSTVARHDCVWQGIQGSGISVTRLRDNTRGDDQERLFVSGQCQPNGVRLGCLVGPADLDGIAKGYIVDRAVEVLRRRGADRVLVNAGGDMASAGEALGGAAWRIGLQDPRVPDGNLGVVQLQGESVATSGDYMQYLTPDMSLHHILDPRTGSSPGHTSGVSVVAPSAMAADALSTAALVLGPRAGIELLDRLDGIEGMIVMKDQAVLRSRGLGRYIV